MRYLSPAVQVSKKGNYTGKQKEGNQMKIQKLIVVLVILIMAVCITACGSKDSSDKCNCKEGACMKDEGGSRRAVITNSQFLYRTA